MTENNYWCDDETQVKNSKTFLAENSVGKQTCFTVYTGSWRTEPDGIAYKAQKCQAGCLV